MENTKTDINTWNDVELLDWIDLNGIMSFQEISEKQLSRKQLIQLIDEKILKFD